MDDDEDDSVLVGTMVVQDGDPDDIAEFDTLADALTAMRKYIADDGVIEVHKDGCDGHAECGCGFETYAASELFPKAQA